MKTVCILIQRKIYSQLVQLPTKPKLIQMMVWRQKYKPLFEPMMALFIFLHMCATQLCELNTILFVPKD